MPKRLAILGSTGSIGRQTLEVVAELRDCFEVVGLACGTNVERLAEQTRQFRPQAVSVRDEERAEALRRLGVEVPVYVGEEGLERIATLPEVDLVVVAVTGLLGLKPLWAALQAGKDLAPANKEPLVVAGEHIMRRVREQGVQLVPIDSEHSAIFQVLRGEDRSRLRRIILTASGGPFRGRTRAEMEHITVEEALAHPTWQMGPKVTIDSATLMNKGLEVIEAHWLFGVEVAQIDILIHPQSIVHSLVEFVDGSVLAQMDWPDMRTPIQFALTYPERQPSQRQRLDLLAVGPLTFEPPDWDNFPCLGLAYAAAQTGGTMPAVLNAANEIAVQRFLGGEIGFLDIPRLVESVMEQHTPLTAPSLDDLGEADAWARAKAEEYQ